jgi:proline iminopeptidase
MRCHNILIISLVMMAPDVSSAQDPKPAPLTPGEFTFDSNGLKLWYKVSGAGPVCVMPSPGWGASSDLYFRTMQPLEKLFTVVYLDSRGTGRSQKPAAATDYTWDLLIADVEALRVHLKQEKLWLMGHSEGGMTVLQYAAKNPDRVQGLILISTSAVVDKFQDTDTQTRLQRRQNQSGFAEAVQAMQRVSNTDAEFKQQVQTFLPLYWAEPSRIAQQRANFDAQTYSAAAGKGLTASKRFPFDLTRALRSVKAPALIVVGTDDAFTSPTAAKRLHLNLPNSKLLLLESCGHYPWLEQSTIFFAEVPVFLDRLGFVK